MIKGLRAAIPALACFAFVHPAYATPTYTISDGSNDLIFRQDGFSPLNLGALVPSQYQVTAFSRTGSNTPSFNSSDVGYIWRDNSTDMILGSVNDGTSVAIDQLSFLGGNGIVALEIDNHLAGPSNLIALQSDVSLGISGDTVFNTSGLAVHSCLSNPANPCGTDQITGLFRFGNGELLYSLNGDSIWLRQTDGTITIVADAASLGAPSGMSGLSVVSQDFVNQNVVPEPATGSLLIFGLGLFGLLQSSSPQLSKFSDTFAGGGGKWRRSAPPAPL